ncbi:MAG: DUF7059 domain-containing protein [Marmoricola sp.]
MTEAPRVAGLELMAPLRAALQEANYTYAGVAEVLGEQAHAALFRNETTPGLRATNGGSPIETLTRLWLLQAEVSASDREKALPDLIDPLCAAGILARSIGSVAAAVDLRPYAADDDDLWVLSDLTPGLDGLGQRVSADHVLGISPASTSLAEMTIRRPVASALDLGTGCGVQALHLAKHAGAVTATDVNARALWLTRLNAALNEVEIDVRDGSFFEPVRGERFDLITTNPPFVISPATGERLVYRDSGLPGDRVVEHVVRSARDHLNPGGIAQVLANWLILKDQPWEERLASWAPQDDLWVVQREIVDLPTYVEMWLKDAGQHPATGGRLGDYRRRYETWLSWLEQQGAEGVGFGWITIRPTDAPAIQRCEHWPYEVAQPIGDEIARHFDAIELVRRLSDDQLRATHPRLRIDVLQETVGAAGAEDPAEILVRQQAGLRRGRSISTGEAALLGACDGDLTLAALLGAVEELTGETVGLDTVRGLVAEGWLTLE